MRLMTLFKAYTLRLHATENSPRMSFWKRNINRRSREKVKDYQMCNIGTIVGYRTRLAYFRHFFYVQWDFTIPPKNFERSTEIFSFSLLLFLSIFVLFFLFLLFWYERRDKSSFQTVYKDKHPISWLYGTIIWTSISSWKSKFCIITPSSAMILRLQNFQFWKIKINTYWYSMCDRKCLFRVILGKSKNWDIPLFAEPRIHPHISNHCWKTFQS